MLDKTPSCGPLGGWGISPGGVIKGFKFGGALEGLVVLNVLSSDFRQQVSGSTQHVVWRDRDRNMCCLGGFKRRRFRPKCVSC